MFLHICTVGLGSTISTLQVGMVENVKFNDDLATFFATFFAKSYTVHYFGFYFNLYVQIRLQCIV